MAQAWINSALTTLSKRKWQAKVIVWGRFKLTGLITFKLTGLICTVCRGYLISPRRQLGSWPSTACWSSLALDHLWPCLDTSELRDFLSSIKTVYRILTSWIALGLKIHSWVYKNNFPFLRPNGYSSAETTCALSSCQKTYDNQC